MTTGGDHRVETEPMWLSIDDESCQGHGRCAAILPERINLDELGYPLIADGAAAVHDTDLARAEGAVDNCPERAISLRRREPQ